MQMLVETDDNVVQRVRNAIALFGAKRFEGYQIFLADNRTFEAYWQGAWDAIRTNTVETLSFGPQTMLKVGRAFPNPVDSEKMVDQLAWELDAQADKILHNLSASRPNE